MNAGGAPDAPPAERRLRLRGTLAGRLILWVGAPGAALFLLVMLLSTLRSRDQVMRDTEESSRNIARLHAQRIENRLARAAVVAEMVAGEMEHSPKAGEGR